MSVGGNPGFTEKVKVESVSSANGNTTVTFTNAAFAIVVTAPDAYLSGYMVGDEYAIHTRRAGNG